MKKLKHLFKDIIYITIIASLIACCVVLFLTKEQKASQKEVYGIIVETNSGVVKTYHIESEERYNFMLQNSIIQAGNFIKKIEIEQKNDFGTSGIERRYIITMTEYDNDVTTLDYSWSQIYHIEYMT